MSVLAGCDGLLEVELPDAVTDDALDDPESASVQVSSVIAQFECGYSSFMVQAEGYAGTFRRVAGASGGDYSEFDPDPGGGECDQSDADFDWYDPMQIGRSLGFGAYERITEWTDQEVGGGRERMLATVALYNGAILDVFGEHMCEVSIEAGPLMGPTETLDRAEEWVNTALGHIANTGDFALQNEITNSIETLSYGLRARIRWAKGDLTGAREDALRVPQGFTAWVTREAGEDRRNKAFLHGTAVGYGIVNDEITHSDWTGEVSPPPNPVTGQPWPDPIPFTGFLDLAILPDGRAIDTAGNAITTADAGAVADGRVPIIVKQIRAPDPGPVPNKYTDESDDIPWIDWEEMWLILAEIDGGQEAIDRVNDIRAAWNAEAGANLPMVTYGPTGDQIEDMIIEERRRAFFMEGRFWATKLRHLDKLWFPRGVGQWPPPSGFGLQGGIRQIMPQSEYELNQNFTPDDRGSACDPAQAPIIL